MLSRFRSEKTTRIPVVRLQGMIIARSSPLKNTLSLAGCAAMLEKAFHDKRAPAVAILVNSPGGSAVQARLIFKRIRDLAEENKKHVFVFIEDAAASGGYMIACAGDEIYADPSSIVGSIGVISSSFGFPEFLKKTGIERRVYTAGKNKALLDPFQPEKKEDIGYLQTLQLEIHELFIHLVKDRRKDRINDDNDDELFSGLFWTGIKGKELGLIDGLGDVRSVLKARYGKATRLKLISGPRSLFASYKPAVSITFGHDTVDALLIVAEEHALRIRYGL
ncbi:MAG: Periplasmic serine protease [Candidatus Tokpelaia sp. JSC085]|nr:MAG: Periplasmic serine protease [Candidatus Tokpelaia sp. JSC085]